MSPRLTTRTTTRTTRAVVLVVVVLALVAAYWVRRDEDPRPPVTSGSSSVTTAAASTTSGDVVPPAPSDTGTTTSWPPASSAPTSDPASAPAPPPASPGPGGLPSGIAPVERGDLTQLQVLRDGAVLLDARSSGLARYNTSASCEVPGQPCYDAPTFDRIARIDLGAPPEVPGTQTTFITGHSNRYRPDDPAKGVFSRLQNVRTGDTLVVRTTRGVFVYAVTLTLSVPFDRLTTTDAVVRVRPDTVVAISCVIAPDRSSYLGNYVVVGTLQASAPA